VDAGAILTLSATILLVGLTAWYAWETRRIVRSMERDREELLRPVLVFEVVPWTVNLLKLRVQNVGNGAALRIAGQIRTQTTAGEEVVRPWSYSVLTSQKYEEFGIPMPSNSNLADKFNVQTIKELVSSVRAEVTYESVTHARYELNESIPVPTLLDDWASSGMLATEDHPERIMPRIAKALENIEKDLSKTAVGR
jgi:hypothetical protein